MMRRHWLLAILSGAISGSAGAAYPDKPIRILVPWATGGATDQIARMLSQPLSREMGVPVVVENKAGAGGVIGVQQFVKEKADGHSLLLATSSTNAAAPHLHAHPGFDPVIDFTPVVSLCRIPNVMVVPVRSPWNNLKDIVTAARQAPDRFTYGSAGIGGSQHLAGAQFKTSADIDIRHVPYKGSGPAAQDLMAGHIDMMIDTGSLGSIRGGLLKPIAVAADKRLPALAGVPTFAEAGTPMLASAWYGIVLPANAAADVVARLNAAVNRILQSPEIKNKLVDMGAEVMGGTAAEFGKFMAAEVRRYEGIVRDSGAPKE